MSEAIHLTDYTLEEELGRGDLTVVYRGRRKTDQAIVAVKVVGSQFTFDKLFVRQFQEAAHASTHLDHPNIAHVYEVRWTDEQLYLVQELIEGLPLEQVIAATGPLLPERMLAIARQVAAALDYAHQQAIIHGDLTAGQVYLGSNDRVMVADFGQAQALAGTGLVKHGYAPGSPKAMAPELIQGQPPDRLSDLYALGLLCYQMLAGEPPFSGPPAALLHAHAYEPPPPLAVPGSLNEVLQRMLAKEATERYQTGAEFTRAMALALEGTVPMRPVKARPAPATNRAWLWLLALLPLLLILTLIGFSAGSYYYQAYYYRAPTPITRSTASTATPLPSPTVIRPGPSPQATASPPIVLFPTPGPPTIAADSPLTNLQLARQITPEEQPAATGDSFAPGPEPIYLFFAYEGLKAGTAWGHRWRWADLELAAYHETWPASYNTSGTAWVFYRPAGGFEPGPYQVTLEINGQSVATATFVVQPGGL
jgi:serine/threonine protein kinase